MDSSLSSQAKIQKQQGPYRKLIARMPELVFELAPDGTSLMVNDAVTGITGYRPEELAGKNWWDIFFPEDAYQQVEALYTYFQSGDVDNLEMEVIAKDGQKITLLLTTANEYSQDSSLEKIIGIGINTSKQKYAEEVARRSLQQLAQAQQIAHLGSWLWDIPSNTLSWSEEMYRINGVSPAEVNHTLKDTIDRVHPDDREIVEKILDNSLRTGMPFNFEHRIIRPDGLIRTVLSQGEVILDEKKQPVRMVGTAHDITELKQAEEALYSRDELFRTAISGAPVILFVLNAEGIVQYAIGKTLDRLSNYQNVTGRSIYEFASSVPDIVPYFERARSGKTFTTEIEIQGNFFETHFEPVKNNNNQVTIIIGIATDITERKAALETLRESEERFRLLAENVQDYAIFTLDPTGRVTSWNAGAQNIKGYTSEEIIGQHFSRFYPPEKIQTGVPKLSLNTAAETGRYEDEGWRIRKDGSRFWASISITALRDKNGNLRGFSKVVRDISHRKQAEEAIKQQTQYLKLLQEIAAAANQAESMEEAIQFGIDCICKFTGWEIGHAYILDNNKTDELVSLDIWHFDDPGRFEAFKRETNSTRFTANSGLPGMVLSSTKPVWMADVTQDPSYARTEPAKESGLKTGVAFPIMVGKSVVGILEFFTQEKIQPNQSLMELMANIGTQIGRVVEREWADEALRSSEARFRSIFENAALGIELIDLEGHLLESNSAVNKILGYTPAELRDLSFTSPKHNVNFVVNDDLFHELKSGKLDNYQVDKPFLRENGHIGWSRLAVSLMRDAGGQPQSIIAMIEDITERKQMENDLAELQRRLMEGRESERLHLAQELHDGPVQDLYGLSYRLKSIEDDLNLSDPGPMIEMRENLYQVIRTLRTICGDLRPPTLAPFGLEKAIRSHAASFQEEHPDISVHLELMPDGLLLSEKVRLALYRIYQQTLMNVIRHSQASQITVRFSFDPEQIRLEIQDNGAGFVVPTRWIQIARQGHLGLVGAAERAEAIGGQLKVESAPGKGTSIRVLVPRAADLKSNE